MALPRPYPFAHKEDRTQLIAALPFRFSWGDRGLTWAIRVAAPLGMIERGRVCIGNKHRGGAAAEYFAELDVSLEETAICVADGTGGIVREARHAKAAIGAMPNKTDRNDVRDIAQIMRIGWYRAVHVKSPPCRSWRALLTARRMQLNKSVVMSRTAFGRCCARSG